MFYSMPKEKIQQKLQITAMTLESKVKVKYVLFTFIACNSNSSFILLTEGNHILLLLMVCRIQLRLQIVAMTLESKVKVKYA